MATTDNDSIQNFLGDIISCFLGTVVGYFFLKYNLIHPYIKQHILVISFIVMIIFPAIGCQIWPRNKTETVNRSS